MDSSSGLQRAIPGKFLKSFLIRLHEVPKVVKRILILVDFRNQSAVKFIRRGNVRVVSQSAPTMQERTRSLQAHVSK
jgi:hypothetical protein